MLSRDSVTASHCLRALSSAPRFPFYGMGITIAPIRHAKQCLARDQTLIQCWPCCRGCSQQAERSQSVSISMPSFALFSEAASGAEIVNSILSFI